MSNVTYVYGATLAVSTLPQAGEVTIVEAARRSNYLEAALPDNQ